MNEPSSVLDSLETLFDTSLPLEGFWRGLIEVVVEVVSIGLFVFLMPILALGFPMLVGRLAPDSWKRQRTITTEDVQYYLEHGCTCTDEDPLYGQFQGERGQGYACPEMMEALSDLEASDDSDLEAFDDEGP
jgi:hypothetical protein